MQIYTNIFIKQISKIFFLLKSFLYICTIITKQLILIIMENEKDLSYLIDIETSKLFYLSLLINRYSKRCVNFEMRGMFQNLNINVYEKKDYKYGFDKPITTELSLENSEKYEWYKDSKERLRCVRDKVEFLEKICIEDKVPYDWCNAIKGIVEYEF